MLLRDQIEARFERWGRFVFRRPRATLSVALALTLGLASQLPQLRIDGSAEAFLHPTDPVRISFDRYRAQFGRDNVVLIGVEAPEIFSLPFLEKLRVFHRELESEVPQLQDVTSLINARYTHGSEDELIVEDLLEDWPKSSDDLALLRERVFANPLYRNYLISDDGRLTSVLIELDTYTALETTAEALSGFDGPEVFAELSAPRPFLTGAEIFALTAAIEQLVARHDRPDFKLYATGPPLADATLMTAMQHDIALFVGLSLGAIALLLFILFRRLSGVVLPLLVVVLSLVSTVASMALTGVPVTLPIQILPSLLLTVGVGDSVHVLAVFFRSLEAGRSREEALVGSLGHVGLAILLTSLTTAGGLASLASAGLAPVVHFGIFGPLGVLYAFFFTLVLIPALLALIPLRERAPRTAPRASPLDRFLLGSGALATRHPGGVVLGAAALLGVACLGAARLEFSWDPLKWLPQETPFRVATEFIDQKLRGSMSLEIQLETGVENGFHDPLLLRRLDELGVYAASLERGEISIGKMVSVADVLKEIHQALNENRPEYYTVPREPRLIAQEFLLFENTGSDDLEDMVDSQFSMAGITMRIPSVDGVQLAPFLDEVEAHFQKTLGDDVRVTLTGGSVVAARTFYAVIVSMARSYTLAFLVITPLMVLLLGSLRAGLIAMIPNLTPIVLTLGLMGWLGLPLDFSTMMIGAIILGVAVDDTIHFMHGFRREYARSGDAANAVRCTLERTGRALLFTSIILCAGFLVYLFASMANLYYFGILATFAIAAAFLADVLLAPALLLLFRRPLRVQAVDPAPRFDPSPRASYLRDRG